LNSKGLLLSELSQYDQAIECFEKAIQSNKDHFEAWYNKGLTYVRKRYYNKQAIECFEKVVECCDETHWITKALNNQGVVYYKEGKYDDALECFEKAIEQDHYYKSALDNIAITLRKLNKEKNSE
jgi:tetratricopeptide (TPR) repeat protein